MKKNNQVNSELTIEKLKTMKGFENVTDSEAEKEIDTIKKLAKILFYLYVKEEQKDQTKEEQ